MTLLAAGFTASGYDTGDVEIDVEVRATNTVNGPHFVCEIFKDRYAQIHLSNESLMSLYIEALEQPMVEADSRTYKPIILEAFTGLIEEIMNHIINMETEQT